jgi:hypothetical protein
VTHDWKATFENEATKVRITLDAQLEGPNEVEAVLSALAKLEKEHPEFAKNAKNAKLHDARMLTCTCHLN